MTPFQKNLETLLRQHGALARLAKHLGTAPTTVGRWKRGGEISDENLDKVCKYFGKSREWMLTGKESSTPTPVEKPAMNLNAKVMLEVKGKVWATPFRMSMERGLGQWIEGKPGEQDCFALQVEGDSMMPLYVPGDYIVCRPHHIELSPHSQSDEPTYVPYEKIVAYNNRDAVVMHEGDIMLKRIKIERKSGPFYDLWMYSLNREYNKVKVHFGDEWRMQALVLRTDKPRIPE